jgi:hypothetical protein
MQHNVDGVAKVIHACERCSSSDLDEYWEVTPLPLPGPRPEPLFVQRLVQACRACGHEHREADGKICERKRVPANARFLDAPVRTRR